MDDILIKSNQHWILRVSDGNNFRNSKYPFWGVKRGRNDCIKTIVLKFTQGDILWFMTNKQYGGKLIGVAEYTCYYDKEDEPLIKVKTYSNNEQNWKGEDDWSIQIHYKNLYMTEKQNIYACIKCAGSILKYTTFIDKIDDNLYEHYKNFKYYAEPKQMNMII